jgi:hypothetical protein
MTTDAERARHLSDIAAAGLGQAAFSLRAAMEQIEAVDRSLDTMGHAAGMLNQHALGLAVADDQEDRWRRLNAAREDATALDDRLRSTQRVLAGEPLASDGVDLSADDHLRRGAAGIEAAEQALHELQWVDGHDARATEGLADRASVLRAAVNGSREAIGTADLRIQSARDSLAVLTRGDYLRSGQEPRYLAAQVAGAGAEAGRDIGRARGEVTRTDGRLDTARPAAASAARDSAELAARAGLNPTPRSHQRHVASTGGQDRRQRLDGSQQRDPQNRGRD